MQLCKLIQSTYHSLVFQHKEVACVLLSWLILAILGKKKGTELRINITTPILYKLELFRY